MEEEFSVGQYFSADQFHRIVNLVPQILLHCIFSIAHLILQVEDNLQVVCRNDSCYQFLLEPSKLIDDPQLPHYLLL